MRNMSFVRTINQIQNRTQTVTRRLGWQFLKPGDLIRAVEKQALKAGETVKPLAVLRVINVRRERLADMIGNMRDVELEGFTSPESNSNTWTKCPKTRQKNNFDF